MKDFVKTYFQKEQESFDSLGNKKRHADRHAYEEVLRLANAIAFFQNSNNQRCAKVLIDQARTIKELQNDNASYINAESERRSSEQYHAEQMYAQCGGYE